jgi:membrane-associated PAP2 superfamily phosphatase
VWRSIDRHAAPDGAQPRRREWQAEALFLIAVAAILTLAFAYSSLDITAARVFFRRDALDHWPFAAQRPWSLLYRSAPWITASLVVIGLAALGASCMRGRRHWRRYAVFVLLSVALGPGLLANVVFKDHWQHPRPRDIVEFGGPLHYVPSPLIGNSGGASFPCGHCTVGFLYGLGWWIWRRRRPARAKVCLAVGLVLGGVLGIGRMTAGGHFMSDILWSAVLAFGVSHVLYYHALRLPQHATPTSPTVAPGTGDSGWLRAAAVVGILGAAGVLGALFAVPHGRSLTDVVPLAPLPAAPRVLEVNATQANITIVLVDAPTSELSIEGELHGLGCRRVGSTHMSFWCASPSPRCATRSSSTAGSPISMLARRCICRPRCSDA